jgi:hypothetical protein
MMACGADITRLGRVALDARDKYRGYGEQACSVSSFGHAL